jgi:hypothetical protein
MIFTYLSIHLIDHCNVLTVGSSILAPDLSKSTFGVLRHSYVSHNILAAL